MQIDKSVLAEKNYEGTRLIEIKDETVKKLKAKLKDLQLEINPTLEKMEKLTPILDPFYTKIGELEREKSKIKEEMAPVREKYDALLEIAQKVEQRAQLIKNKMQPLVNRMVEKELGEFEKANQLIDKDDKIYVEVVDEIEELVKKIRTAKTVK